MLKNTRKNQPNIEEPIHIKNKKIAIIKMILQPT